LTNQDGKVTFTTAANPNGMDVDALVAVRCSPLGSVCLGQEN
jgi:hypothetical protein